MEKDNKFNVLNNAATKCKVRVEIAQSVKMVATEVRGKKIHDTVSPSGSQI